MKRLHAVALLVAVVAAQTLAANIEVRALLGGGFSAGRDGGQALGYNLASYTRTETSLGVFDTSEWNDEYASFGNGLKIDADVTMYLNDNFGVMAALGISFLGGRKIEQETTDLLGDVTTDEIELNGGCLPILVGVKFKTSLSKVAPYLYLATGIYIPLGIGGDVLITGTGPDVEIEMDAKMSAGWGVSAGLGAVYQVNDKIGICAEFAPTYAFARVKELETKTTISGVSVTTTEIFERDEASLPNASGNTTYVHGGPMLSLSSVAIKVGVVMEF